MTAHLARPRAYGMEASHAQERIHARVEGDRYADNVSRAWRLTGPLDAGALQRALESLAARHETLRTGLAEIDGRLTQVVHERASLPLRIEDLRKVPSRRRARAMTRLALEEAEAPFALSRPPLARPTLLRLGDRDHVLLLIVGHAIWDAASTPVFERDLLELYAEHSGGRPARLPEMPIQYGDLAATQRSVHHSEYWRAALAQASPSAPAPLDRRGSSAQRRLAWAQLPALTGPFATRLALVARREQAPLSVALLSGFSATLAALCDAADVTVAIEHANRDLPGARELIAFCIDALLVVTSVSDDLSFRALLRRTRSQFLTSVAHRIPVRDQLRHLPLRYPGADEDAPAMHELVLNFVPEGAAPIPAEHQSPGLRVSRLHTPKRRYSRDATWPNATLLTTVMPGARGALVGYAEFDPDVIDDALVRSFARRFVAFLALAALAPERKVGDIAGRSRRIEAARASAGEPPRRHWSAA